MIKCAKGGEMIFFRKIIAGTITALFMLCLFSWSQDAHAASASVKATPVVETQWLEDNLKNVKVIFVDNWPSDKEEYMKKHIKGSVYMGIGPLMGSITAVPPDKAKFEEMMNRLGINNGDHVVLYGAKGESVFTLSAFWLMEYFGHDKISFLNGGLAKWNKENRSTEGGMKKAEPGKYKAKTPKESIRTVAEDVLKNLNNPEAALVDARGTGEYTGEVNNDNNKRVGHIPGALDLGYDVTNFNKDGTLKSIEDLKAVYEAKGVTKDKEVITYCQAGIKASNAYFTLKHILGYPNVKVYVSSWGEWGNKLDPEKYPVEK
jgi:thiosulfate/3-mercaptopyruvate sulfurtransferase